MSLSPASPSLSDERFLCSICLEVFTEPVSTPCGHNFCKLCITECWSHSESSQCPLCMETFRGKPQLRVNTEFKDVLEILKRMKQTSGEDRKHPPPPPPPSSSSSSSILCDLCGDTKAFKSCLVCLASFCVSHLEPHRNVQALTWHKLINPVKSLEERACRKHNKLKEFFCRNDQICVCTSCLNDDHVMHDVVALDDEVEARKTTLKSMKMKLNQNISEKTTMVQKIQNLVKHSRQEVEKTKSETIKTFDVLVALIESRKKSLIDEMEEKQEVAEKQADALIGPLQQEINKNNEMINELEDLLTSEDDFRLLQDLPSVSTTSDFKPFTNKTHIFLQKVRNTLVKMEEKIQEMMLDDGDFSLEETVEDVLDDELGKIKQKHGRKVTLDVNTAHPALIISEDRRQVRDGGTKRRHVPDASTRFDCLHYVLGTEGFSSGRFYFEVTCPQTSWEVGVTRETIGKRGVDVSLSPQAGCWTLGSYSGRVQVNSDPPVVLPLNKQPQRVGVFVDYDKGLVSFYNVDTRSLMFSFTKCVFTKPPPPQQQQQPFLSSVRGFTERVYTGIQAKTRIYPIFRPGSGPMQISK